MFIRPFSLPEEKQEEIVRRLWDKDPSLWTDDGEMASAISNRLGWLDVLDDMEKRTGEIQEFASAMAAKGIKRVFLLGMGGSSLCPLVISQMFSPEPEYPALHVLDTTDPDEVELALQDYSPSTDLVIVASKSGSTLEPNALFSMFWEAASSVSDTPGEGFIAITDPGSPLEAKAREKGFLKTFLNPPDIGGRYSALTLFGLVPAALQGVDIGRLLSAGRGAWERCRPGTPLKENPGWRLGSFLGEFSAQSRDKLTILADPGIRPLGLWIEQLIAESTGKETRGIVPIIGETTGIPGFYGAERIFVYLKMRGTPEEDSLANFVGELKEADFPVLEMELSDPYEVGGQFFIWEMATAIAAHCITVNPFDEPDVVMAKQKTNESIERYRKEGKFSVSFWVDPQSEMHFRPSSLLATSHKGLLRCLRDMLNVLPTWGYVGFLPYLPYDPKVEEMLAEMRHMVRQERGCATTLGFGPRYLHSTGQIHKGGPMSAGFIIFTRQKAKDYPVVPDVGMSMWHIQFAQALGDFEALSHARRRVIHVHLPSDYRLGMEIFFKVLSRAAKL